MSIKVLALRSWEQVVFIRAGRVVFEKAHFGTKSSCQAPLIFKLPAHREVARPSYHYREEFRNPTLETKRSILFILNSVAAADGRLPLVMKNEGQVASYLGALHRGGVVRRVLVLCPATVLAHWMAELHAWAPQLRVVVLHRCVQAFNAAAGSSGIWTS